MIKEEAKQKIAELITKYESLSPTEVKSFNEAKTKQGFIEPLFRALGWNFEDTNEVSPEEKASGGRVDYAFKLNNVSLFFLEAKPLRADLTNIAYIKQAVTYAYNKGVTWALLTDFETLVVYVAQTGKPFITLTCDKYLDAFDDMWLLSKESFQHNALAEKAERYGALPQRMGIEQRLFNQLRQWREELSTQLHSYNKNLSIRQIDEVIQRLFNRLIFIRTCEDRGIENKVLLSAVHEWVRTKRKGELIEKLREIFRHFDGYYDSELFQHHLTDKVDVESETIENLINGLYEVPGGMASYDFSIIDADVLGAVYEQYLGHIANIVKQKAKVAQAKMDLGLPYDEIIELTAKKQRRKEHGIYYTPKFITDYIVKETVGRFLAECSTNEIRNIKILDPACGSGSFLIRAFDELLKHYANQKISKSEQDIDAADRISILQSNIFGVDLDIQAVEIARLNLLLRSLAKRDTLPGLKDNIKEGNSLISGTEEELKKYFGKAWKDKKAFNWEQEFKNIMDNGGFDIVIGNPPWVESKRMNNPEKTYYEAAFQSMHGQYDIFNGFVERGLQLLKNKGILGFIVPSRFVMNPDYEPFRKMLLEKTRILNICDVGEHIFEGVEMPALIIILEKQQDSALRSTNSICIRTDIKNLTTKSWNEYQVIQKRFENETNYLFTIYQRPEIDDIIRRIEEGSTKFGDLVNNARGVEIGKKSELVSSKQKDSEYVPFLVGEDIDRYSILSSRYLKLNDASVDYKTPELYQGEKIIVRKTGTGIRATLDSQSFYVIQVIYIFKPKNENQSIRFLLGLLNSKLISFYYFTKFGEREKKVFPHLRQSTVLQLPIHCIDLDNPSEKKLQDNLVSLVDKMLELNKKLAPIRDTPFSESDELKKEIELTDKEIDNLVYDLYGLTEEERKIVEGG